MKLIKFLLLFLLFLASGTHTLYAQENPNEYVEDKPVLMKNEATFAIDFHSNGWGIAFRRGINLTGYKKWIFEGDFVGMKHPKETKTVNPYFDNAKSYIYGKLNTFHILRLGTGIQKTIYSKADRHGVEIRMIFSGGLSLGITKPVYLNILKPTGNFGEFDVVTEKYNPQEHFLDNIYGRAPFTEGLGEIKFHPGLYTKLGFNFEYAPIFEDVKALEIGTILEGYSKEIPIMALLADNKNKQIFLSFYINIMFGRKW